MGLFDQLKRENVQEIGSAAAGAVKSAGGKRETFTFASLPKNAAQLQAMPEAALTTPFMTAALTAAVLCRYEESPQDTIDMLNFLKGPQPMSVYDQQFLRDRLKGRGYIPRSYFAGSSPQNNYEPSQPFSVTVSDNPYSYTEQGYVKLFIRSSGADSERPIQMRQKGAQWFLWVNLLMADIRKPAQDDPWA